MDSERISDAALAQAFREAVAHYEKYGHSCDFEGHPMIYASIFEDITDRARELDALEQREAVPTVLAWDEKLSCFVAAAPSGEG